MQTWKKFVNELKNYDYNDDVTKIEKMLDEGDQLNAKLFLNEKLKNKPDNLEFLFLLGVILADEENFEESIECYDRILSIDSHYEEAIYNKSKILAEELFEYQKALDNLDLFSSKQIQQDDNQQLKAEIFLGLGEFEKCNEICIKYLKNNPKDVYFLNILTDSYQEQENYEKAYEINEKVLKILPEDFDTLNLKSGLLNEFGKYDESLVISQSVLDRDSENEWAWIFRGDSLTEKSEYSKAIESYETAISINTALDEAWFGLFFAQICIADIDNGLDSLLIATALDKENLLRIDIDDIEFKEIKNNPRFLKILSKKTEYLN